MSKYHSKPFTQTKLFGVVGLLLAVPVAVCIKTIERYYAEPIASPDAIEKGRLALAGTRPGAALTSPSPKRLPARAVIRQPPKH